MKRYFKLFIAALLAVTMAIFVAACDDGADKSDGKATDVSGKTYVYVDGTVSGNDQITNEDLNEMYKDVTITFNADGTVASGTFYNATWKQSGADVTLTISISDMGNLIYNCKATGKTLTMSASSMGVSMKLNFKLVENQSGDDNDNDNDDDDDGDGDAQTGVSGKAYVFEDIALVSNTGNYPASAVEDIISSGKNTMRDTHFVFEKSGRFLAVKDNEAAAGTWAQNGTTVAVVVDGETQSFTLDGNKISVEMSEGGLTLKITYTYDKDFTFDGVISGGGEATDTGRAYSFKSIIVTQNTSGVGDQLLISEMEKYLQDSHFIFKEGGEFIAVQQGMAVAGTWSQKGSTLIAEIDGEPQEFTSDGDLIYVVIDSGDGVVVKITYSYDKDYTYNGPITDIGGGPSVDVGGEDTVVTEILGEYRLVDCHTLGEVENEKEISDALFAQYESTVLNFTYCEGGYGEGEYVGGELDGNHFKFHLEQTGDGEFTVHIDGLTFLFSGDALFLDKAYSEEYGVAFYLVYQKI